MYPSLLLDFALQQTFPPALACVRSGTTANYFNKTGLLVPASANTLRIGANGLYVEPEATNLFIYSRDLTRFTLTGAGTVVTDYGLDGGQKYIKVNDFTASATSTLSYTLTGLTGTHTLSFYARKPGNSLAVTCTFGTQTINLGTTGAVSKYTVTANSPTVLEFTINASGATLAQDYVYIDCVQIEAGVQHTTPIHTNGSTVSRAADEVYIDINQAAVNNWFMAAFGTLLIDAFTANIVTAQTLMHLYNTGSGATDYFKLQAERNSITKLILDINSSSQGYTFFGSCDNPGQQFRAGTSYTDGEQLISLVGRSPLTGSMLNQSIDFSDINRMYIGRNHGGTNHFNGTIRRLAYYPAQTDLPTLNQLTNV